jgi:hypothetical protein
MTTSRLTVRLSFRFIVRLDAVTEAVLAGFCLGLAVADPRRGTWQAPTHVSAAVWWALAAGLAGFAALLWRWSSRPTRALVTILAAGNAVTGLAILAYASIVDSGSAFGALLLGAGVALVGLAAAQAVVSRRAFSPRRPRGGGSNRPTAADSTRAAPR